MRDLYVLRYILNFQCGVCVASKNIIIMAENSCDDVYFQESTLCFAAKKGCLDIVKLLYCVDSVDFITEPLINFEFLSDFEYEGDLYTKNDVSQAMDYAVINKHLHVLEWLLKNTNEVCTTICDNFAYERGDLELLKQLHECGVEFDKSVMDGEAASGNLHVIQWLHENRKEGCTKGAMDRASTNGYLHVVQWLHENRKEGCTTMAMNYAAAHGHLHVVQWLHERRNEGCTQRAIDWAAASGHLEVVKWLCKNRTEGFSPDAIAWARKYNHLHVVEFMLSEEQLT